MKLNSVRFGNGLGDKTEIREQRRAANRLRDARESDGLLQRRSEWPGLSIGNSIESDRAFLAGRSLKTHDWSRGVQLRDDADRWRARGDEA